MRVEEGRPGDASSPERIRALAHPLRLELLDHLGEVGSATATECAEHVGESVASCSFHLRMLEKYGFIQRAERRGREKPWRLVARGQEYRPDPDQPGSYAAVAELARQQVLRETERIQRCLAQMDSVEDEWVQASVVAQASFWATADELAQLSADLVDLVRRFDGRNDDPALRPEGARRSRLFGVVNPDPVPAAPLPGARAEGRHRD